MTPVALVVATLSACAVLALFAFFMSGSTQVDEMARRLSRYGGVGGTAAIDAEAHSGGSFSLREVMDRVTGSLNPVLARSSHSGKLAEDLQKADLRIKSSEWVLAVLGIGCAVGLLLTLRFGSIVFLAVGLAAVYFLSGFYLRFRQKRRTRAFNNQLGDTIMLLSNALKAGYSFSQALSTVSKSAGPPMGIEFSRATREIALGIPVDDALNHMVERNQSEDFDLLVTAVQIQRVVGGNLAEILDTIAHTIRERVRIQGEIRTLTAQARFSGWIITLLPVGLAGILTLISPDYFRPMLVQTGGKIMLAVGGVSMAIGVAIIQKIVKIEV